MIDRIFTTEPIEQTLKKTRLYKKRRDKLNQIRICKEQIKEAYELLCEEERRIQREGLCQEWRQETKRYTYITEIAEENRFRYAAQIVNTDPFQTRNISKPSVSLIVWGICIFQKDPNVHVNARTSITLGFRKMIGFVLTLL